MKVICFYLPQFHETEENNMWWGKGYTEWTAVRNAVAYCKGQTQPRTPLGENYYDLSNEDARTWIWQAQLASQYGIYGFCIYHYWFSGRRFLEKPVEILRKHKEIQIHYSLCWDPGTFKRTWYASNSNVNEVLIQQDYGDEQVWKLHFIDLLPDFQDARYIKIDNRPVFHIHQARQIACLERMRQCWDELAIANGFSGIYLVVSDHDNRNDKEFQKNVDAYYNFEPTHAYHINLKKTYGIMSLFYGGIRRRLYYLFQHRNVPYRRSYGGIGHCIMKEVNKSGKKTFYGAFCDYDDTPRRQEEGKFYSGNTASAFMRLLRKQIKKSILSNNEFLYINAWNEWGESAYLEPDEKNGYLFLEIIKQTLQEVSNE